MTAIRGYADYNPNEETMTLIAEVKAILQQNAEYLPLSLRQIFYLGVSSYRWPKTEKFYKGLCAKMSRARRAQIVDFEHIRDDGITEEKPHMYDSEEDFLEAVSYAAANFRLNPMLTQPQDVVVWTEGKGLVPMVRRFTDKYRVTVITSGGFDGLTLKHQIAKRFDNRFCTILHVGDYDPSGEVMFRALMEDVRAFGGLTDFQRIAVNREQIDAYNLPTKPPKVAGNTHANSFDDDITVELEALPPALLENILCDAIEEVMDMEELNRIKEVEEEIRLDLKARLAP